MPFFSLNTSPGFYTKLSQRQGEFGLVSFNFKFTGVSVAALFLFIGISQYSGLSKIFWIDQSISYIYMAAIFSAIAWITTLLTQIADAYGLTVYTEMAGIAQRFLGLIIILILFYFHKLNLTAYFIYLYVILLVLIFLIIWILGRNGYSFFQNWHLSKTQIKGYVKEFYIYSQPLFIFSFCAMIMGILERWLLQKYGGSIQQGFFGLSFQIGAVCFLFTSAMTPLIMREFSIAYGKNDIIEMSRLFRRYIPLLYSVAAFFGCFACVQAEKLTHIFAGGKFAGATVPVMIMSFYPIHQTYGQLSGSLLLATNQTKLVRNIGIFFAVLGLPLAYLMVAPTDKMGLNAGAIGLAIKFVIIQFIAVNVQLFFVTRMLKLNFIRYLGHQIFSIACLMTIALFSKIIINVFTGLKDLVIVGFLISGLLYSILVMVLVYFKPIVIGFNKDDVKSFIHNSFKVMKLLLASNKKS
jgi:O-antigen/teichoic acid export membrane protein